jgi:hypothetical protein
MAQDNLIPENFTGDLHSLAHCRLCRTPMFMIYDWKLRDYCHECMVDMSMEEARRIIKK